MAYYDDLIKDWVLKRFIDSTQYDRRLHGEPSDLSMVEVDAHWECGCYSEYTRDDQFVFEGKVATKAGNVRFHYGRWSDLPDFIEQISEYEDTWECHNESFEEFAG